MNVKSPSLTSRATVVTSVIVVIAAVRLGRDLLIPFALAVLLSFLLAPLVILLQRRIGRAASAIIVIVTAFTAVSATGWLAFGQVSRLAKELPVYQENIREKIRSLRESAESMFGRASRAVENISAELSAESSATQQPGPFLPQGGSTAAAERIGTRAVTELVSWLGPFMAWLGKAAVVVVLVLFILLYYDDLRDRMLKLIGTERLNETTRALDDAAGRVSRYLFTHTVLNASHGLMVGVGLYFLGLPAALLWGISSALLRFIPYIGPLLSAAIPIGLALAVFDNWSSPLLIIGFLATLEIISNNVLEPWLYGSSTGLAPMAVIVAAMFWTWLWGGVGLVLSTPLTVCLVVLGKHVAQLHFLDILLSDQSVLDPKDRLYHRLLAMDHEAALEIAEEELKTRTLEEVYDHVLIPALAMSELDRHRGGLEEVHGKFIIENMRDIIEELGEADRKRQMAKEDKPSIQITATQSRTQVNVLCLPARDDADELAGIMFAQLLVIDGHQARCLSVAALAGEMLDIVQTEGTHVVCVSALPPSAVSHSRYLRKRLRARFAKLPIVVGLWTVLGDPQRASERVKQDDFVKGVTTLAAGREAVRELAQVIVLQ